MSDAARIISVPGGYGIFGGRIAEALRATRAAGSGSWGGTRRSAQLRAPDRRRVPPRGLRRPRVAAPRDRGIVPGRPRGRSLPGGRLPGGRALPGAGRALPRPRGCARLRRGDRPARRRGPPAWADRRLGGQLDARDHLGHDPRARARVRRYRADPDGAEPGQPEPPGRLDHRRRPELPGPDDPRVAGRPLDRAAGLGRRAGSPSRRPWDAAACTTATCRSWSCSRPCSTPRRSASPPVLSWTS